MEQQQQDERCTGEERAQRPRALAWQRRFAQLRTFVPGAQNVRVTYDSDFQTPLVQLIELAISDAVRIMNRVVVEEGQRPLGKEITVAQLVSTAGDIARGLLEIAREDRFVDEIQYRTGRLFRGRSEQRQDDTFQNRMSELCNIYDSVGIQLRKASIVDWKAKELQDELRRACDLELDALCYMSVCLDGYKFQLYDGIPTGDEGGSSGGGKGFSYGGKGGGGGPTKRGPTKSVPAAEQQTSPVMRGIDEYDVPKLDSSLTVAWMMQHKIQRLLYDSVRQSQDPEMEDLVRSGRYRDYRSKKFSDFAICEVALELCGRLYDANSPTGIAHMVRLFWAAIEPRIGYDRRIDLMRDPPDLESVRSVWTPFGTPYKVMGDLLQEIKTQSIDTSKSKAGDWREAMFDRKIVEYWSHRSCYLDAPQVGIVEFEILQADLIDQIYGEYRTLDRIDRQFSSRLDARLNSEYLRWWAQKHPEQVHREGKIQKLFEPLIIPTRQARVMDVEELLQGIRARGTEAEVIEVIPKTWTILEQFRSDEQGSESSVEERDQPKRKRQRQAKKGNERGARRLRTRSQAKRSRGKDSDREMLSKMEDLRGEMEKSSTMKGLLDTNFAYQIENARALELSEFFDRFRDLSGKYGNMVKRCAALFPDNKVADMYFGYEQGKLLQVTMPQNMDGGPWVQRALCIDACRKGYNLMVEDPRLFTTAVTLAIQQFVEEKTQSPTRPVPYFRVKIGSYELCFSRTLLERCVEKFDIGAMFATPERYQQFKTLYGRALQENVPVRRRDLYGEALQAIPQGQYNRGAQGANFEQLYNTLFPAFSQFRILVGRLDPETHQDHERDMLDYLRYAVQSAEERRRLMSFSEFLESRAPATSAAPTIAASRALCQTTVGDDKKDCWGI